MSSLFASLVLSLCLSPPLATDGEGHTSLYDKPSAPTLIAYGRSSFEKANDAFERIKKRISDKITFTEKISELERIIKEGDAFFQGMAIPEVRRLKVRQSLSGPLLEFLEKRSPYQPLPPNFYRAFGWTTAEKMNSVRQRIKEGFHKQTLEKKIAILTMRLEEGDRFNRQIALRELGRFKAHQALTIILLHAIEDPDTFSRQAAIRAIGSIGHKDDTVEFVLQELKKTEDPYIRSCVLEALARLDLASPEELAEVRHHLFQVLDSTKRNDFRRVDAISALGDLSKTDETIDKLLWIAEKDKIGAVRDEALRALGILGATQAKELFFQYILGKIPIKNQKELKRTQIASVKGLISLYRKIPESFNSEELMEVFKNAKWLVMQPIFRSFLADRRMIEAYKLVMGMTYYSQVAFRKAALSGLYLFAIDMQEHYPLIHTRMFELALGDANPETQELAQSLLSSLEEHHVDKSLTQL